MKVKDRRNYLVKVVDTNKEGKPIIQLYTLKLENGKFGYEVCDIERMDWDVAKKIYSVIGFIK